MPVNKRQANLPKFIKSITVVRSKSVSGQPEVQSAERIVVAKRKKRESKGFLGFVERVIRHGAKAQAIGARSYLLRHDRSNRKRRDGWLRDQGLNRMRAQKKALKAFKFSKLFG